jgi:hypothetical protein
MFAIPQNQTAITYSTPKASQSPQPKIKQRSPPQHPKAAIATPKKSNSDVSSITYLYLD